MMYANSLDVHVAFDTPSYQSFQCSNVVKFSQSGANTNIFDRLMLAYGFGKSNGSDQL